MKDNLVRFGVAMEPSLVAELDKLAEARGSNRSELIRDMARAEVGRSSLEARVPAFAAVTLVYNHHVRELSEKLTALQHDLGDQVRSTMHVHLDHEHCLEVVVMRGRSDQLRSSVERMLGTRGVIQGGAEYVAEGTLTLTTSGRRTGGSGDHEAHERHTHAHAHPHAPVHDHPDERVAPKAERAVRRRGSP
jgi:CopG family transcriptional regulator, nickel-responsive regulator